MLQFRRTFRMEHTHLIFGLSLAGRRHGGRYACVCGSYAFPETAGRGCSTAEAHSFWQVSSRAGLFYGAYAYRIQSVTWIVYLEYMYAYRYVFPAYTVA